MSAVARIVETDDVDDADLGLNQHQSPHYGRPKNQQALLPSLAEKYFRFVLIAKLAVVETAETAFAFAGRAVQILRDANEIHSAVVGIVVMAGSAYSRKPTGNVH